MKDILSNLFESHKWLPILALCLVGNFTNLFAQDAVAVSKSVARGITSIETGTPFRYRVIVRCDNTGVEPCTNFVLSETLPFGLEFTSDVATDIFAVPEGFGANNPPIVSNFNSGNDPTFNTPGSITLNFGDVAPGASAVISFNVRFHKSGDVADGYSVSNTATLTSDNDVNTGNNSVTSPPIEARASSYWIIDKKLSSDFALGSTTTYSLDIDGASAGGIYPYYAQNRAGHLALYNPIVVDILEIGLTCADVDATVTSGMSTGDAICLAPGASGTLTSGIMFTNPSSTNYALVFDHEAIFTAMTSPYRPNITTPQTGTAGNSIDNQFIQVGIVYDTPTFSDEQQVTNKAELWGSFSTSLGATNLSPIAFLDDDNVSHTVNAPSGAGKFEKSTRYRTVYIGDGVSFLLRLENSGNNLITDVVLTDTLPSEMELSSLFFVENSNTIEDKTITLRFTNGTTQVFTLLNGENEAVVNTHFTIPAGEQVEIIEAAISGDILPGKRWDMNIEGTVLASRWRDDSYTARYNNPDQNPDIDVGGQLSGSNVMDDEELTNCGHYTATTGTGALSGSACAYKMIVPKYIPVKLVKTVNPATPQAPGTTLTFTLTFGGSFVSRNVPYDDITTLTFTDTLPAGLTYVPGSEISYGSSIINSTTHIPDVDGTGRDLVIFEVDRNGDNGRLTSGRVSFQAIIDGNHPTGTFDNTYFITDFSGNNNTVSALSTGYEYPLGILLDATGFTTPLAGSAPNDISAPPPNNGADVAYQVISLPAGKSIKFVDADLTPGQSGSGGVELGSPGSTATFSLLFENNGNDTLQDLRLIDLLPRIGDTSPLTCTPRNTEWKPDFAGNITATFISNGMTTSVSPSIEYSTDTDPCVAYWVPGGEPCGPCNTGTFSTSPPGTLGDVLALGFDFGTLKILPGDSILVSFDVAIPNSPTPKGIAWNTFAWSGIGVISGSEVGAEPPFVGISTDEFDLALTKMVSTTSAPPYAPGSTVSFDIRVVNQGDFPGFDIDVLDYFNASELNFVSFSNPNTTNGGNPVVVTVMDADGSDGETGFEISALATGDEVTITANFTLDPAFDGTTIINEAEIVAGSVFDEGATTFDIDSDLALTGGSGTEVDDEIGDPSNGGTDNPNDQDDFDFAEVFMCSAPTITATGTNISGCSGCDGEIRLVFENVPSGIYSINYEDAGGMPQTIENVNVAVGSFTFATITDLCAGIYNNLTITVGGCTSTEDVDIVLTETCVYDFGDLPDTSASTNTNDYQTTLANNGPRHQIINGLYLGKNIDDEIDGQLSNDALGDGADEDGLAIYSNLELYPNMTFALPFSYVNTTGNTAHVEAWIDWNADGAFDGVGEMVADWEDSLTSFRDRLEVIIPPDAEIGGLLGLRIRISNQDNMTPYGEQPNGEVEDYLIGIGCPQVCLPIQATIIRQE